jgi:hypothetical protein
VLPTEREREELTCPPSILGDAERDRALAVTRGARGGAGPGGGDPGLPAEVWRRGARGGAATGLQQIRGRAEERDWAEEIRGCRPRSGGGDSGACGGASIGP